MHATAAQTSLSTRGSAQATADADPSGANPQRAAIAVALAPVLVLGGFTLVIADVIAAGVGFAVFAACTGWVVYEMRRYMQQMDSDALVFGCQPPEQLPLSR